MPTFQGRQAYIPGAPGTEFVEGLYERLQLGDPLKDPPNCLADIRALLHPFSIGVPTFPVRESAGMRGMGDFSPMRR